MAEDSIYLYNLTLRPPSHAAKSIAGQFSGSKKVQELVLHCGSYIEVYRPVVDTGKVEKILSQNVFAIVENIDKIRLAGSQKDLLVITSDSGKIAIAELDEHSNKFIPIAQEPHSKSGLRRITPGEYLCVDPNNRAVMIGALERNKLVYKVELGNSQSVQISSALENSSKNILTLTMCALDTNYENPLFAAIEVDSSDYSRKKYDPATAALRLHYYELDQGLNHIVQKRSKPDLPPSANLLVAMPGHIGGVVICCESYLIYEAGPNLGRVYLSLPVRKGSNSTTIINSVLHTLKKNDFFLLLQSSIGDLYKLTVEADNYGVVSLRVTYFDSIPICNSINVLRSGFLFANTSSNNKLFYQFELLGDENDTTTSSVKNLEDLLNGAEFSPQGLQNLALVDILESLFPLVDSTLVERNALDSLDPLKLLVTLSSHSYMKTLTYGLPITELVSSPIPMVPTVIFTTRISNQSPNDQYLVLSSSLDAKTLVLSIGEVVEEVADSGLLLDQSTLAVQQVGQSSIVQVHANGIRHIRHIIDSESGDVTKKVETDWYPPAGITVLQASTNNEQVIIGLSNRGICYFEIDPTDDQLIEYQERFEVSGGSVTAIAILTSFISQNDRKSAFAVVGISDETVQVLSLLPHNCFEVLTLQALSANCHSLLLLQMNQDTLYAHIGMTNGIYVRVHLDPISGKLSDTRLKYLGTKPVQLRSVALPGLKQLAILAISSKPWLGYFKLDYSFRISPLLGSLILSGTSFISEDLGTESIVGIDQDNLTIFTVGNDEAGGFNVNNDFTMSLIKLRYSPRKQLKAQVDHGNWFFVIESECDVVSPYDGEKTVDSDYYDAFGYERSTGSWASCLEVVNFDESEVSQSIEFKNGESAISICQATLNGTPYVVVGLIQDQVFAPPGGSAFYLDTFKLTTVEEKVNLTFYHRTKIDGPPSALNLFNGKLAVAVGKQIRLYEMGIKQLLRKSSLSIDYLRRVNKISHLGGDVIIVGDSSESISYLSFNALKNQFVPLTNDIVKRQVTTFASLDNRTIIGADKFGNLFVNRIPKTTAQQMEDNILIQYQEDYLGASSTRFHNICEFFIQDVPTSFQKGTFVVGGTESIIYTGLQGTVGLLLPLGTKHDVDMLIRLETLLRKHFDDNFDDFDKSKHGYNLTGREHTKYRSYYNPVKNVIDGDFVERFYELSQANKIKIAGEVDRVPREVERKLHDLRNRAAF